MDPPRLQRATTLDISDLDELIEGCEPLEQEPLLPEPFADPEKLTMLPSAVAAAAAAEVEKEEHRRELVKNASKRARNKRKHELVGLREENKRLKEEREELSSELRALESEVQRLRSVGTIDLNLENELLKLQLHQHKTFISGFFSLMNGAPGVVLPDREETRRSLLKRGADYAVTHMLGLISRSVKEADWSVATITPDYLDSTRDFKPMVRYKRLPRGEDGTLPQLLVRLELEMTGVPRDAAMEAYWTPWCDEAAAQYMYRRGVVEEDDFKIKKESLEGDDGAKYIAGIFHEIHPDPEPDRSFMYVATKTTREMLKSTLRLPKPGHSAGKGSSHFDTANLGAVRCNLAVRTTTRFLQVPGTETDNVVSVATSSMYVEGSVLYEDADGTSRWIVVLSVPENFRMRTLNGPDDLVTPDGRMAPRMCEITKNFLGVLRQISAAAALPRSSALGA